MEPLSHIKHHYHRAKDFYTRYEKWLIPTVLVSGIVVDYIAFENLEIGVNFAFMAAYWLIAAASLVLVHMYDTGRITQSHTWARPATFLLIQFMFGGLLKGFLVFYWFSAVLSISWPLLAIITFFMLFNDVFRKYFSKPHVQLALFFFITLALAALIPPFLLESMDPRLFVAACAVSLVIYYLFTQLIFYLQPLTAAQRKSVYISMLIITATMNILYFTNIIPPIPLAIKEAGVYHAISVSRGVYTLTQEQQTWWEKLLPGQTVHVIAGDQLYAYTAIFAPKNLDTSIIHNWQRYDTAAKKWATVASPSFAILGGRQNGYKGYSWIQNPATGSWRIFVQNQRGQALGKISFIVEKVDQPIETENILR